MLFTVPKNTSEENPHDQHLQIRPGILHQVSILIPPGHAGLTGVALDIGLHQIAPSTQNSWFHGDEVLFSYAEYIEIGQGMPEIVLRGYNLDDVYNHAFVVGIGVLPERSLNAALDIGKSLDPISKSTALLADFFRRPGA